MTMLSSVQPMVTTSTAVTPLSSCTDLIYSSTIVPTPSRPTPVHMFLSSAGFIHFSFCLMQMLQEILFSIVLNKQKITFLCYRLQVKSSLRIIITDSSFINKLRLTTSKPIALMPMPLCADKMYSSQSQSTFVERFVF